MDNGAAAELLLSTNLNVRLRAARVLAKSATPEELDEIRKALATESSPWIKEALIAAELRATARDTTSYVVEGPSTEEESLVDDVYSKAVQDLAKKLVHDIKRVIGYIDVKASKEIGNYADSATRYEIRRLTDLILAIEKLSVAAATPSNSDVNIGDLIRQTATAETEGRTLTLRYAGNDPFIVKGDQALLTLVLTNTIRNAVESIDIVGHKDEQGELIFNWGKTDKEYWFSLLDNGIGLPLGRTEIFEMSQTNKKNHWGMGLYLAKTAVLSMRGNISLSNATTHGATLQVNWAIPV